MNIDRHLEVQKKCAERAEYFRALDFVNLATVFEEAVNALSELVEVINKLNTPAVVTIDVPEAGGNG